MVIPAEASSPDSEPITDLVEMETASQVNTEAWPMAVPVVLPSGSAPITFSLNCAVARSQAALSISTGAVWVLCVTGGCCRVPSGERGLPACI